MQLFTPHLEEILHQNPSILQHRNHPKIPPSLLILIDQFKGPRLMSDKKGIDDVQEVETASEEVVIPKTKLDILWSHAFRELEHWAKQADFRDEVFLKEASYFADSVKRNQENIIEVTEQFNKEFVSWEKTAREEFLMSTTTLQHFFPKRSYEEVNKQIDDIKNRMMTILNKPCQFIANNQVMDQYLNLIEQYIAFRQKGRKQYIKAIKQAGNLIYESQKGFIELFSVPIKAFVFPLNKYLENTEELTKSK